MNLLHTLLELGHSTSLNLGTSYDLSPRVSYGEETITESNLLEIQRRHPSLSRIRTFSKTEESKESGADWEWHLIGRAWTLKLRIQAKRVAKNGSLRGIHHKSKTASQSQIDLLINSAKRDRMRPVYCFYCTERHRKLWTSKSVPRVGGPFETGCLLAPAEIVKSIAPKWLEQIEHQTKPWHFLWSHKCYTFRKGSYGTRLSETVPTERYLEEIEVRDYEFKESAPTDWNIPSIFDLNGLGRDLSSEMGIFDSEPDQLNRELPSSYYEERGIGLVILLDVSQTDTLLLMSK